MRTIANISDGSAGNFGGRAANALPEQPAIVYVGQRGEPDRLVTVYDGMPHYQSSGKSASQIAGQDAPFFKKQGEFYPFLGIQEKPIITAQPRMLSPDVKAFIRQDMPGVTLTDDSILNRGWVMKGYDRQGNFIGSSIKTEPALQGRTFRIEGRFTEPEQVNQWLAGQNANPNRELRDFWPNDFDRGSVEGGFISKTLSLGPTAPTSPVIVDWNALH